MSPIAWWRRFLALPNVHPVKTAGVALLTALVCSLVVSVAAVTLKPYQDANKLRESAANMMSMLETLGVGAPTARLVDLESGAYALRDPGTETALPPGRDLAGLKNREDVATVYEVREGGELEMVILPVRGSGYQSTIKAYLALKSDLNTVAALTIYEQGETPGLGSRIGEDAWQSLWRGKKITDDKGNIRLEVVKGAGQGDYEVDGISGATRTSLAVSDLVQFWLGPDGYGPYLARLESEGNA